jgi:2-desacetyl-2-hydroxyethyl bacteriochlorophyllide A dehydrogenase
MKALCTFGPRDIRCDTVPDPTLLASDDAIIRVTACGICGSDLHIYHGHGFSPDQGYIVGHEAVGEVVETGSAVTRLRPGDRVMVSAAVGCGRCVPCLSGHIALCANNAAACYGLSHALPGCQAEAVRVPHADFNAIPIADGITEDQALLLTDALATAWFGCANAEIRPGSTVAVVGLGPIGLMAAEIALLLGAARVFAIDLVPSRLAIAATIGATPLHAEAARDALTEITSGRMADSVVEAVGADATIALALRLARRAGTVSVIGVNQTRSFAFPMAVSFAKGLTFRIGTCSVQDTWPALIPLLQTGRLRPQRHITHRLPLADGAEAYRLFDAREDGVLKTVLFP